MKLNQIAAQLYTVRDFCRTAPDLAATARRIRAIGYPAVQLSGLGPIPPGEVAEIMAGDYEGLDRHTRGPVLVESWQPRGLSRQCGQYFVFRHTPLGRFPSAGIFRSRLCGKGCGKNRQRERLHQLGR